MMINQINDPQVKHWLKLKTKAGRLAEKSYLLEKAEIVLAAVQAQVPMKCLMLTESGQRLLDPLPTEIELITISDEVAQGLSETYSPQVIFAEVVLPENQQPDFNQLTGSVLMLDGVQDPGNVGTLIRTANAAGVQSVLLSKRSADLYSDKVLRATKGANFKLNVYSDVDLLEATKILQAKRYPVFGTLVNESAKDYRTVSTPVAPFALILGNEGQGMSASLAEQSDENLYIPLMGDQDSLNVAIAGAIIIYRLALG